MASPRKLWHPLKELCKGPRRVYAPIAVPTMLHIYLAADKRKKMQNGFMGTTELAKGSSVQFLFNRLSFVAMAFCQINHSHTLIFKGILFFHKCLNDLSMPFLHSCLYKLLTVSCPFFVHFHFGLSTESVKVP
jgi:succinate dehydrogenase hydrophobic anchor subunit